MTIGITEVLLIALVIGAMLFPSKTKEYAKKFYTSKKIIKESKEEVEKEKRERENAENAIRMEKQRAEEEHNAIISEILSKEL